MSLANYLGSFKMAGVIRRGCLEDARAAADLWLRVRGAAAAAGTIPAPVHDDADVRRWFREVVVPSRELWVAVDEAGVVCGVMVLDGDWLDQLYVDPPGRGVGGALLAVARRERPDGLRLWTFASNRGAQRFYERHGFVEVRRTDGSANEERAPDILYAWMP
jgi:GNAT superfamily N-acetyltransferase